MGQRVRKDDLRLISEGFGSGSSSVLAFVMESCPGCQRLLADLSETRQRIELPIALVARAPSPQFHEALSETGLPIHADNGEMWKRWKITNTPLVLKIGEDGRVVAKGVTHHVDAIAMAST